MVRFVSTTKLTKRIAMAFCLLVALCVKWSSAQEWHDGEATVVIAHITPEEAEAKALQEARHQALESTNVQLIGITNRIMRESPDEFTDNYIRFTRSISQGRIVDEQILSNGIETTPGGQPVWRVRLKAKIFPENQKPDPTFTLSIGLDRELYRIGEAMIINLTASKDCYVTLFCLYSVDSLQVVIPNNLMPILSVPANALVRLPPADAGWEIFAQLPNGQNSGSQALLAVATLDLASFYTGNSGRKEVLYACGDALLAINRWLIAIPADRRTEDLAQFEVHR